MKNKSNKNTQSKYLSFEQIFMNSLVELFHHESPSRIFSFNDLQLIDTKYLKDFFNMPILHVSELVDLKELSSLINVNELKLFRKKDFNFFNWKQISFFTQYVGAFSLVLSLTLGTLGAIGMSTGELTPNMPNMYADIQQPAQPVVTFLSYVDNQNRRDQYFQPSAVVLGSNTFDCSFTDASGSAYESNTTIYIDYSGSNHICAANLQANQSVYVWSTGSNEMPTVSNSSCFELADVSENDNVTLAVYDNIGNKTSSCGLNIVYR